jgi:hypothetical protein
MQTPQGILFAEHAIAREVGTTPSPATPPYLLTISFSPSRAAMTNFDPFAGDFQFTDFTGFPPNPIVGQSMQNLPQTNFTIPQSCASPGSAAVSFDGPLGKKRRLDSVDPNSQPPTDEPARHAAEEDKRRRNTAASARFRVKKKQREQALEKTAKDMTDRVNMLESKIAQLETENTWLKGLITNKGDSGAKASTADVKSMLKKRVERSSGNHTDGVGTEDK